MTLSRAIEANPCILVGVSGGRDSVALLHILHEDGVPLQVCHVHHGLRGHFADRDAAFVEALCAQWSIPCRVVYKDVPAYVAQQGIGLEEAARKLRYEAFSELACALGISQLALAQHADDQTETALLQFLRGSAFAHGMAECSTRGELTILRPLLGYSRDEITEYCLQYGLRWCEDETNAEPFSARNRLRHEAIPLLQNIMQRDVTSIIVRSAKLNNEAKCALEQAIDALELIDPQGRLYLPKFTVLPYELQKSVLFFYLRRVAVSHLSEDLVLRVLAIVPVDAPARCSLPGGMTAHRKEKRIFVSSRGEGES